MSPESIEQFDENIRRAVHWYETERMKLMEELGLKTEQELCEWAEQQYQAWINKEQNIDNQDI